MEEISYERRVYELVEDESRLRLKIWRRKGFRQLRVKIERAPSFQSLKEKQSFSCHIVSR